MWKKTILQMLGPRMQKENNLANARNTNAKRQQYCKCSDHGCKHTKKCKCSNHDIHERKKITIVQMLERWLFFHVARMQEDNCRQCLWTQFDCKSKPIGMCIAWCNNARWPLAACTVIQITCGWCHWLCKGKLAKVEIRHVQCCGSILPPRGGWILNKTLGEQLLVNLPN